MLTQVNESGTVPSSTRLANKWSDDYAECGVWDRHHSGGYDHAGRENCLPVVGIAVKHGDNVIGVHNSVQSRITAESR